MKSRNFLLPVLLILQFISFQALKANEEDFSFKPVGIVLSHIPFTMEVRVPQKYFDQEIILQGEHCLEKSYLISANSFKIDDITISKSGKQLLNIKINDKNFDITVRAIPGWLSLMPPLAAIILALLTREMILSLFVGIWAGVTIICNYNPFTAFFTTLDDYVVNSLADHGHASIVIFSLLFGGMIGIMSKNGSMLGIVDLASKHARTRRRGQLATSLLGIVIFFDDYANAMLVGNTMRPFTDKLKISREKLAYIVDSTAAPVTNLAVISTWAVFEMSLLDVPYTNAGITVSPYITFIKSIPYAFYSIFALWFLFSLGVMKRDFGLMYKAEMRALRENKVLGDNASPLMDDSLAPKAGFGNKASHWLNAISPIIVVLIVTILGLYITGINNLGGAPRTLQNIIGNSNSYAALMWGAALGGALALLLSISQKILSLKDTMSAWLSGIRAMILAALVLVLAWTLGNVCDVLNTAEYIVHYTRGFINPVFLPFITFVMAAVISFSTGTSWGTMTILVPLIIPLAMQLTNGDVNSQIFLASFASILSGATFGDHCSPISDTTILSSMASGSDHIDHVKTQLPYALTICCFAILFGYIPIGFGINYFWLIIPALFFMIIFIRFFGKRVEEVLQD